MQLMCKVCGKVYCFCKDASHWCYLDISISELKVGDSAWFAPWVIDRLIKDDRCASMNRHYPGPYGTQTGKITRVSEDEYRIEMTLKKKTECKHYFGW